MLICDASGCVVQVRKMREDIWALLRAVQDCSAAAQARKAGALAPEAFQAALNAAHVHAEACISWQETVEVSHLLRQQQV